MVDYYATDDEIAAMHFSGRAIPAEDTIDSATLTLYKGLCMDRIKGALGYSTSSSAPDDDYGRYKACFLWLFGLLLQGRDIYFATGTANDIRFKSFLNVMPIKVYSPDDLL